MAATDPRTLISRLLSLSALASAFVVAAILSAGPASAEDNFTGQGYVHAFNNDISVYTGLFALNKDVSLDTSVYGKYTVDFINPDFFDFGEDGDDDDHSLARGFNVAAVSGASAAAVGENTAGDTRHQLTGGVTHDFPGLAGVELYYDYSYERDFQSHTPTVTLKKEFFQKNTTMTLGYSRNMDTVDGRFMASSEDRTTDNWYVGLTQVLSPVMVARAGYSRNYAAGAMEEGVRLVAVDGEDPVNCSVISATCVEEAHPDSRTRQAYLLGLNRYFTGGLWGVLDRSATHLTLRYYTDDWEIRSVTTEVAHYKYLSDTLILRLNFRFYDQTPAFFVKNEYTSADVLRTSSPQLVDLNTQLYGVKVTRLLDDGPYGGHVEAKYEFYDESIGVNAHIVMVGARLAF